MKIAPACRIRSAQRCGSSVEISRCSGAIRLAISQASSRSRTFTSAPRSASDFPMTAARGMPGSSRSIDCATRSMKPASGVSRMACAISSCSACENRSIAIQSGSVLPSQMTRISEGPAIMSMPTVPNTRRLASAT